MKGFSVILLSTFFIKSATCDVMNFEFGVAGEGDVIYSKDGHIPILQYETKIDIPVPPTQEITHIRITMEALSPPKVDYDNVYKRVTIKYTWTQISLSTYNIVVSGKPLQKQ